MGAIVQYYNLTGGLNTVNGIGTLNETNKRTESPDMKNVEFYKLGGLKSMEGNTQFSSTTFTASVSLGYEFVSNKEKNLIVCTADGKVYIYNKVNNSFEEIYKFPTPTSRHSAVGFNDGVVISNGVDDLIYYHKGRHTLLSGLVSVSSGKNIVSGSLTKFKEELNKGDYISFDDSDKYYVVEEITDDTSLTLSENVDTTYDGVNIYLGELSLLNAIYTNSDDTSSGVNFKVRGLALNAYQGRLFVGGTDGTLYYSEIGLIHGWDLKYGAGAIPEFYNDSSEFTALGLWAQYLVIFKRERTYLLDGTNSDDTQWSISPYSIDTVDSQQSWLDAENGIWGFSRHQGGIYSILQRTIYNATFGGNELSKKIADSLDYINQAKYDEVFPVFHPQKGYIMFYIPLLTGIGSNNCFIYDIKAKAWLLRVVPQEVTAAFKFKDDVYIGTKDGKILKEFAGLTFDGKPIDFYWKSPFFSFGDQTNNKTTKEFRIKISEENTNNFHIRNRRDGKTTCKERNIDTGLGAFIGLVWDIDYNSSDFNEDYTQYKTVTKVKDNYDKIYYVNGSYTVASTIPVDIALYSDVQCNNLVGYTGYLKDVVEVNNQEEADKTETLTNTYYSFTVNVPKYFKWTNGNQTIWIDFWQRYPEVNTTCKYSGSKTTLVAKGVSFYTCTSFNLKRYAWINIPYSYNGTLINKENYPNLIIPDRGLPWGNWLYTSFSEGTNTPANINNIDGFVGTYRGSIHSYRFDTTTKKIWYESTTSGTTATTPEEAGEATISNVVENEDNTFTVTLSDDTVLENLAAASYTETMPITLYSKVKSYKSDELIYLDLNCISEIGAWRNYTDNNGNTYNAWIPQNKYPLKLEKPTSYLSVYYKYYSYKALTFTSEEIIENIPDPKRPVIVVNDTGETITDTVWDNDAWVVSRHIVKRFPLPNQYFQTMQIELYGNAENEGMMIYGFEIDGIELEEVPFK